MISEYFFIQISQLKGKNIFPFHIYIFNKATREYLLFLNANSPLTNEKIAFLIYLTQNGGEVSIAKKQKLTFLNHMGLKEEDINITNYDDNSKEFHEEELTQNFDYSKHLYHAFESENFDSIIRRTRIEVSILPNKSEQTNLARSLSKFLDKDIQSNRIAATSFFFAKILNLFKDDEVADLFIASLIYHFGETQIPYPIVNSPFVNLNELQRSQYLRHSTHTIKMLRNTNFQLSDRCKDIITYHHDRLGSNSTKKQLANILGGVSYLFEYASGSLTGDQTSLKIAIERISKNEAETVVMEGMDEKFLKQIQNILKENEVFTDEAA